MEQFENALVLAPHPDDGEFGAGGTIKKIADNGTEVHYAAFSPCRKSIPGGFDQDVLYKELTKALSHLGINNDHIITYDFEVREFPKNRQEILEELILLKKNLQPQLVLMPNSFDVHQDHQVINREGKRAFKHQCVLGYDLPWNYTEGKFNFFVALEQEHMEAKFSAVNEYESQGFRSYKDIEFFRGLARTRGIQAGCEWAEAFEVIRWIIE